MLSLKSHNVLDYVLGIVLILLAGAVGNVAGARSLFLVSGAAVIIYSLLTNYYYSVLKLIPLGAHMVLDCIVGAALFFGPWLFGYRNALSSGQVGLHIVSGIVAWIFVAVTSRKTDSMLSGMRRTIEQARVKRDLETAGRR